MRRSDCGFSSRLFRRVLTLSAMKRMRLSARNMSFAGPASYFSLRAPSSWVVGQLMPDTCSSVGCLPTQMIGSSYSSASRPMTLFVRTLMSVASSSASSGIASGLFASISSSIWLQAVAANATPAARIRRPWRNARNRSMSAVAGGVSLEVHVDRERLAPLQRDRAVVRCAERSVTCECHLGVRTALVLRPHPQIAAGKRHRCAVQSGALDPGRGQRIRRRHLAQLQEVRRHDVPLRLLAAQQPEFVAAPLLVVRVARIQPRIVALLRVLVRARAHRADRAPLVVAALVVQERIQLQVPEQLERVRQAEQPRRERRADELLPAVRTILRRPAVAGLEQRYTVGPEDRSALCITLDVRCPVAAERVPLAVTLHREEVAEAVLVHDRVAVRVRTERDQLVVRRAERHDRVPAQPVLDDGRSVDPELDALVVDLADVHEVRTRPAAGRRVVDGEQRVLRRLVVEGEVEADTTL